MHSLRLFVSGGTTLGQLRRRALVLALLPVSLFFVEGAYADSLAPVGSSVAGATAALDPTVSIATTAQPTATALQLTSSQPSVVAPASDVGVAVSAVAPQPVPTEAVAVEAVVEQAKSVTQTVVDATSSIPAAVETAKNVATETVAAASSTLEKAAQAPSSSIDAVVREATTALPSLPAPAPSINPVVEATSALPSSTGTVIQTAAQATALRTKVVATGSSAAERVPETAPPSSGVTVEFAVRLRSARSEGTGSGRSVPADRTPTAAADLTKDAIAGGVVRVNANVFARFAPATTIQPALAASFDGATPVQPSARTLPAPKESPPRRAPVPSTPSLPAEAGGTAPLLLLLLGLGVASALVRAPGRLSGRLSLAVAALRPPLLSLSLERPG